MKTKEAKYYVYRIDLLDSTPAADIYDPERYKLLAVVDTYKDALEIALPGFLVENPNVKSWQEWYDTSEDGGYDFIIAENNEKQLFRARDSFKDKDEIILKNYLRNKK